LKNTHTIPNAQPHATVLVDSYLADVNFYTQLRSQFKSVVALDDYNRITYKVDLVINPNVFFNTMDYSNQHAACMGGKEYVLLREAFRNPPPKQTRQHIQNILVTIGGTDYRNLLFPLVEVAQEFTTLHWTIIDPENKLGKILPNNITTKTTVDANEMATLMYNADVVISACGQTLHELVAMQTPAIGICIDHDQLPNQHYYVSSGFLQHKNSWDDIDLKANLNFQLHELSNYTLRQSISRYCIGLINKNGVANIASKLRLKLD
jgi:spore coat polysaccharide biosynthesis predicted glycosyltransferase SpsG